MAEHDDKPRRWEDLKPYARPLRSIMEAEAEGYEGLAYYKPYEVQELADKIVALYSAEVGTVNPGRESPGDHLIRLLFASANDVDGTGEYLFDDDLAGELRERWAARWSEDIEESLGTAWSRVNRVCQMVADILRDWAVEDHS